MNQVGHYFLYFIFFIEMFISVHDVKPCHITITSIIQITFLNKLLVTKIGEGKLIDIPIFPPLRGQNLKLVFFVDFSCFVSDWLIQQVNYST